MAAQAGSGSGMSREGLPLGQWTDGELRAGVKELPEGCARRAELEAELDERRAGRMKSRHAAVRAARLARSV